MHVCTCLHRSLQTLIPWPVAMYITLRYFQKLEQLYKLESHSETTNKQANNLTDTFREIQSGMVLHGLVWSRMITYGPISSRIVLYCIALHCIILYCPVWSFKVQHTPLWSNMVLYVYVWSWSSMVMHGPIWSGMVMQPTMALWDLVCFLATSAQILCLLKVNIELYCNQIRTCFDKLLLEFLSINSINHQAHQAHLTIRLDTFNMFSLKQAVIVCLGLILVTKALPRPKDIHIHIHGLGKMMETEQGSGNAFESKQQYISYLLITLT